MDAAKLIEKANAALGVELDGKFGAESQSAERYATTEVHSEFEGHSVRIEFRESDTGPAEYRYNATLFDAETDDVIATGNGAENWDDALAIVHWRNLSSHWA